MEFSHEIIVPEAGYPFKLFLFEGGSGNYYREKHWHRSVEIFAVCSGELDFYIDKQKYHLEADDFMIVNSNEVHAIASPLQNETIVLQIPLDMFADYYTGEQFIWFSHEPGRRDEHFMELLRGIYEAYTSDMTGCDMKAKSIFYQLMYLLVTDYRLPEVDAGYLRMNRNLNRLSRITSYIKENYAGDLSLGEVAAAFDYSPNYLSRMFRNYAGITFKGYVQSIRLRYAVKDLESGRYSVTEAALRNGFSGSKALARAFQKKYGMLPSKYRSMPGKGLPGGSEPAADTGAGIKG